MAWHTIIEMMELLFVYRRQSESVTNATHTIPNARISSLN